MKLMGLQLSGWSDAAVRDWDVEGGKDADASSTIIDGGAYSTIVRLDSGDWIGGPQAALAPHGLGGGWNRIGDEDRRIPISAIYSSFRMGRAQSQDHYVAAIDALCRHADETILTVSDIPEFDEPTRTRIIASSRGRRRRIRLLWRPVALFLQALEEGLIPRDRIGDAYQFLIHTDCGFEVQILRLRADSEHPGHLAPEREGYGTEIGSEYGLSSLAALVGEAIRRANPASDAPVSTRTELAAGILSGRITPSSTHVFRADNGRWRELRMPATIDIGSTRALAEALRVKSEAKGTTSRLFLASPLEGEIADRFFEPLRSQFQITYLPWNYLPLGALCAGRIIERGLPHYFDRLTPISLAVNQNDEPVFDDLIDGKVTLPANKEYVSPPYKNLEWPKGQREIEFWVLKDGKEARHWKATRDAPPSFDASVELRLRQTPGQSWAKLSLTSTEWDSLQRDPIFLDWASLEVSEKSPAEILEELRTPPPSIPERIIEQSHIDFWRGGGKIKGLLLDITPGKALSASSLASRLTRAIRDPETSARFRSISTDGELPPGLTRREIELFDTEIRRHETTVLQAIKARRALRSNDELRALTWQFTRCPQSISTLVVDALEADLRGRPHPLLVPPHAKTALIQAGGRTAEGPTLIRRFIKTLTEVEPFSPNRKANNNTFAALAMVLSRRKDAPVALDRELVVRIATIIGNELLNLAAVKDPKKLKIRFKNALSALGGLFRFREVEPYALLRSKDPLANQTREALEKLQILLIHRSNQVPQADEKEILVRELIKYLDGGGDPRILTRIDASDEDSSEEDD